MKQSTMKLCSAMLLVAVAAISACSSSSNPAAPPSTGDAAAQTPDAEAGATPGPDGGGGGDGGAAGAVSGIVVDFSTSDATNNFDASKYPPLAGVAVCVYADTSVPCATTDASGSYTLSGAPSGTQSYLSYTKTGFASTLYGVTPSATTSTSAPPILMGSTAWNNSWGTQGGAPPDSTKGTIVFGEIMGGPSTSPFHEVFGTTEYFYVSGYKVAISPAATVGPVYTSASWAPDPSLLSSSAAGWGFFQAAPGNYMLTFTHPTMTCGMAMTKVVAGYSTTYVGLVCSPLSGDAGVSDAGVSDAGGSDAGGSDAGSSDAGASDAVGLDGSSG